MLRRAPTPLCRWRAWTGERPPVHLLQGDKGAGARLVLRREGDSRVRVDLATTERAAARHPFGCSTAARPHIRAPRAPSLATACTSTMSACQNQLYEAALQKSKLNRHAAFAMAAKPARWLSSNFQGHLLVPTHPARARCTCADRPSGGCAGRWGTSGWRTRGAVPNISTRAPSTQSNPKDRLAEQRHDVFPRARRPPEDAQSSVSRAAPCTPPEDIKLTSHCAELNLNTPPIPLHKLLPHRPTNKTICHALVLLVGRCRGLGEESGRDVLSVGRPIAID